MRITHTIAMWPVGIMVLAQDSNTRLRAELEHIHGHDQRDRENIGHCGIGTPERDSVNAHLILQDSLNLLRVRAIIDSVGWLGPAEIGGTASGALFLVIQHADLTTQEIYLPEARLAPDDGKLLPSSLVMLEDRIEMRKGRPQIPGSQVNVENGLNLLWTIKDEETVNERRAVVGLGPMEKYAARFHGHFTWSTFTDHIGALHHIQVFLRILERHFMIPNTANP